MLEISFYLGSIMLANLLVHWFGIVTFFGITFPAGAIAIGFTFSARDYVQRKYGKWKCWIWMLIASVITVLFNPTIAIASASAFLISEFIDWMIFTLWKGSFKQRIFLSNLFGTPIDSLIFVTLAFGFVWPAIWGQSLIKFISSLVVLSSKKDDRCLKTGNIF